MQFIDEVEEGFKEVTVQVVNTYCLVFASSCTTVSIGVEILWVSQKQIANNGMLIQWIIKWMVKLHQLAGILMESAQ